MNTLVLLSKNTVDVFLFCLVENDGFKVLDAIKICMNLYPNNTS